MSRPVAAREGGGRAACKRRQPRGAAWAPERGRGKLEPGDRGRGGSVAGRARIQRVDDAAGGQRKRAAGVVLSRGAIPERRARCGFGAAPGGCATCRTGRSRNPRCVTGGGDDSRSCRSSHAPSPAGPACRSFPPTWRRRGVRQSVPPRLTGATAVASTGAERIATLTDVILVNFPRLQAVRILIEGQEPRLNPAPIEGANDG